MRKILRALKGEKIIRKVGDHKYIMNVNKEGTITSITLDDKELKDAWSGEHRYILGNIYNLWVKKQEEEYKNDTNETQKIDKIKNNATAAAAERTKELRKVGNDDTAWNDRKARLNAKTKYYDDEGKEVYVSDDSDATDIQEAFKHGEGLSDGARAAANNPYLTDGRMGAKTYLEVYSRYNEAEEDSLEEAYWRAVLNKYYTNDKYNEPLTSKEYNKRVRGLNLSSRYVYTGENGPAYWDNIKDNSVARSYGGDASKLVSKFVNNVYIPEDATMLRADTRYLKRYDEDGYPLKDDYFTDEDGKDKGGDAIMLYGTYHKKGGRYIVRYDKEGNPHVFSSDGDYLGEFSTDPNSGDYFKDGNWRGNAKTDKMYNALFNYGAYEEPQQDELQFKIGGRIKYFR